jgi:hypothetical protein
LKALIVLVLGELGKLDITATRELPMPLCRVEAGTSAVSLAEDVASEGSEILDRRVCPTKIETAGPSPVRFTMTKDQECERNRFSAAPSATQRRVVFLRNGENASLEGGRLDPEAIHHHRPHSRAPADD